MAEPPPTSAMSAMGTIPPTAGPGPVGGIPPGLAASSHPGMPPAGLPPGMAPPAGMPSMAGGPPPGMMGPPPGMAPMGGAPPGLPPMMAGPPGMMAPPTVLPEAGEQRDESGKLIPLERGPEMPPRRTIYVNNISCKVPTRTLRKEMISLGSQYGKVVACVCMKSFWRRGQVYISFSTQEEATKCFEELHSRSFAGQRLRVNYAREDTHVVQKQDGTFEKKEKGEGPMRPYSVRLKDEQAGLLREQQANQPEGEGQQIETEPATSQPEGTFQQAAQSRTGTSAYFFSRLAAAKQSGTKE